ncbi:DEAD/DEAH box helicase [Nocardioides koreensis]|uniref:DEAD/DEAH box helicase n=1 Tax=Nocardioides koreensis TaxID=433651 RepID=UPI0031E09AED
MDEDGSAVTLVDASPVYLGRLGLSEAEPPADDGTLRAGVVATLSRAPGSTARELAFLLSKNGYPGTTRTDVNSVLYRERHVFLKDDSQVPRWSLQVKVADGSVMRAEAPTPKARAGAKPTVEKAKDARGVLADSPAGAWIVMPITGTGRRRAPEGVLDLMTWQREAMANWYERGCFGIVEAVTGTGKTHIGLEAVAHAAAVGEKSTVLVPSVDLQDQWGDRFDRFLPSLAVARVGGRTSGHPQFADVTIAVVHSALKQDLSSFSDDPLLVADEVHRYGASEFQYALRAGYKRRLGLTATLERGDDAVEAVLAPYFGGTILKIGFDRAIREGVVAPFRLIMAPVAMSEEEEQEYEALTRQISNGLKVLRSEGALGSGTGAALVQQLGRLRGAGGRVGQAARSAETAMRKRRLLLATLEGKLDAVEELAEVIDASQGAVLFTQSKEVAEEAAGRLREWSVAASALHSGMPDRERRDSLRALEEGRLQALAAPKLLDEGIDVPTVDLGIVMTASRSRRQMVQRLGRVIRRKADGRAVDFAVLYAAGTVEDPKDGAHEGFFDLVGEVATNRLQLETGWTADALASSP